MNPAQRNNVESILHRAKELIQKDREKMIADGRVAEEIATTNREHEMLSFFQKNGVRAFEQRMTQPGEKGFVIYRERS